MRTKILKVGMPIFVFMLAIVFAFANDIETSTDEALIAGYIFENGDCKPASRDCNNLGGPLCKQGSFQVYEMPDVNGTSCVNELTHLQ
ncbi:MAG: DUF6520 family protein [Gelidibacter sp.]